jgi:hypothetical protein
MPQFLANLDWQCNVLSAAFWQPFVDSRALKTKSIQIMDSSQVASALGISGLTLSAIVAIIWAIARGTRSRCIVAGMSVDIHRATSAEIAADASNTQTQTQQQRDSVVNVNIVHTPAATADTHENAAKIEI